MRAVVYIKLTEKVFNEWELLWKRSPNATYANSPYWFKTILECFEYNNYKVITLYKNRTLKGVLGLVRIYKYGIGVYTLPPTDHVCGIPFLVDIDDTQSVSKMYDEILKQGVVYFENMPEYMIDRLKKINSNLHAHPMSVNYHLILQKNSQGTADFANRKELLRRVKKEKESFTFKSYSGSSVLGLKTVYKIDNISRKQTRGYNVFADPIMRKFYETLGKIFSTLMRINILYYQTSPIAYEIGFVAGNRYYGNQLGFAEEFKNYSPGKVISAFLGDYLLSKGFREIDFGSGNSHLKHLLTNTKRKLYVVVLSQNRGSAFYIHHASKMRNILFDTIEQHKRIYTGYRKMKTLMHK